MNIVKKQYKYLYKQVTNETVIKVAYMKMRKGKTWRRDIKYIDNHLDECCHKMKVMLENTKPDGLALHPEWAFDPPEHKSKEVVEFGKVRKIYIPSITEQWVHHIIMQVLSPIFVARFHEHSLGSVPTRGVHLGKEILERWIHSGKYKYVLKMDIRHFYASVRIDLMIKKLESFIKDPWLINLIQICFKHFKKGLPLGFYLSQWLGNLFIEDLDILIWKSGFQHIRYVDDVVIVGTNKRKMRRLFDQIRQLLGKKRLRVKDNWQIWRIRQRRIDFMGFVFYENRTVIRKRIVKNIRKVARKINRLHIEKKPIYLKYVKSILSYMGWIKHSNTYLFYYNEIKPLVNIGKMKRIASKMDRRRYSNDCMGKVTKQRQAA